MPEIPDLQVYAERLTLRFAGEPVDSVRVRSVFTVRTVDPPIRALEQRRVTGFARRAKRIVMTTEGGAAERLHAAFHLMLAGRFQLAKRGASGPGRIGLLALDFPAEALVLTEAGSTRRASVHVVRGDSALAALDPGGVDPMTCGAAALRASLAARDHTLKRALTDGRIVAGIGNAYSDEILHRARLSPMRRTSQLSGEEWTRFVAAIPEVLGEWTARLREAASAEGGIPRKVTAFRDGMAVHGRRGLPCPACGAPVQRIVSGEREANYCPWCQTEGRILRDRALSRLLKDDWPATLDDLR
ncbi:MAG: Formamidopyrimidine-DNA glycosylase [Planctomycetes bacterium]|nr:Formamidopyrimidine-DNA glycosylase [Planctomycetota bacterium]